jgi:hypothetical protein
MKQMWFHLMPYTDLPDDFVAKNNSVWVDVDSKLFDPAKAHRMYNDFMDELEFAASCGFDAVCVNEHHSNAYGLMASPNLIASTLARRTHDAAICVMGNSLALYNPPIRVAEEWPVVGGAARSRAARPAHGRRRGVDEGRHRRAAPRLDRRRRRGAGGGV